MEALRIYIVYTCVKIICNKSRFSSGGDLYSILYYSSGNCQYYNKHDFLQSFPHHMAMLVVQHLLKLNPVIHMKTDVYSNNYSFPSNAYCKYKMFPNTMTLDCTSITNCTTGHLSINMLGFYMYHTILMYMQQYSALLNVSVTL